jgi:two-component system, cell cycle sensor histidine kinase and response regulator CckA
MISFREFSLRNKLIAINMLTAVIILLLTSLAFLVVETVKSRNSSIDKLSSIGNIISVHSSAELSFNDKITAADTLSALVTEPSIKLAVLYDANREVFAKYQCLSFDENNGVTPLKTSEKFTFPTQFHKNKDILFQRDGIHLLLPVTVSEEQIGFLYIHAGLDHFFNRLYTYVNLIFCITFLAVFVAFFLSAKLQKAISRPIQKLTDIMAEVSKTKKYDTQVRHEHGGNEIALLYQGFNTMLGEIDKRDRDLMLTQYSMDHASDGICWVNEKGSITNASIGACNLLRFPREDLLQATIFQLCKNLSREEWIQFWEKNETSPGVHFSIDMLTRSGDTIPVEGASHSVHLKQKLCCILFRDVSEQRKLELQLQRSEKLEAMGVLAGSVAHDLNNILSGITGYPEVLILGLPKDSELRAPLQMIEKSGLKAAAIVQDMVTLSRRNNMVKNSIDINHSVLEYMQSPEYKKMLEFHPGVQIKTDLTAEVDLISASSVHMAKCIMNLVSNGVEAMKEGGELLIRTENIFLENVLPGYNSIEKGPYVLLQITDTGIGISPEDLRQIYEPFYTKKKMGRSGTGLGMTIVWNSVADHDGYITVESEEGSGTSFTLYLPATADEDIYQEITTNLEDCVGNESVLVIDDIIEQRTVASAMLSQLGYDVTVVSSGEEAVEFLKEQTVDILLLDMIMPPGIDGLDTYRKIIETHPAQKVVIASGFAETSRVKELQNQGGGPFIKKPYNLKQLGGTIRRELVRVD